MQSQTETTRAVMENAAASVAEDKDITIEEARTFLALQKLIEDRGIKFVEQTLREHDRSALAATRTLTPMKPQPKR
jgi:hypothetical protein